MAPCTVCAWHDEWDELPADEQATLRARQGVPQCDVGRPDGGGP